MSESTFSKLTNNEKKELARLMRKLYSQEQGKSGSTQPIPFACMKDEKLGHVFVVTTLRKDGVKLMGLLDEHMWKIGE